MIEGGASLGGEPPEANARSAAYLTWPDARLRAFLRNHNMPEEALPTSRPGLLRASFSTPFSILKKDL